MRGARQRRGWSQTTLAARIGVDQTYISKIERGLAEGVPLEMWLAIAAALEVPLKADFGRDPFEEPVDAGHLGMQELMLRLGRQSGRFRSFELPTRPADPSLSIDVAWRDDVRRVLILNECWNTFGNINASVRSTRRKVAEMQALAAAMADEGAPYRVAACWIIRDTRRNRELLARYPEVFAATFTGSSPAWARALSDPEAEPPTELGLVWCDVRATRVFSWRRA